MARFAVHMFGPLRVDCGGRSLGPRDFGGVKPKQVLEILLLARGHSVPKDRLADMLWGEQLPRYVSATLETYVSVLRRHLCPERREGHTLIVTEPEAYRFAIERAEVDLDRFDRFVERAARADTRIARTQLEAAIALVRGEVLEDEPYAEWVQSPREFYRERLLQALADAGSAALSDLDYAAALGHAERAVSLDSANERAYRTIMLAHYALDRPREALRAFDRCRVELERELDATPSPETERLCASIRRHEDVAVLLAGPAATLPTAANGKKTHLVGRDREVNALEDAIRRRPGGSLAFVLVEGEAGIGKSALLELALERFPAARVGSARCSRLERDLPYAALAGALREALADVEIEPYCAAALGPILPELALGPPRRAAAVLPLEALVRTVRRAAPLVLVFDDLHDADRATIMALGYLARRCRDVPLAIVGAVRPAEVGREHPLRSLAPTLRLQLGPLAPADLAAAGLDGALYTRTGGHPLLVSALSIAGGALPPQVLDLLAESLLR